MVKIKVEQGWLEGAKLNTCVGNVQYYSFKGIPYALPPLGKLRFKAPQPPVPWDGVRSATEHGANCPQKNIFTKTIIPGDEDCLHLNVYTPDLKPARPLAVMFYIHGGGYQSGSGDVTHLGPDFLVQHGVVVVTINYRLGPLGFLCLDTRDVPGNAGLKDQVAALKWVQRNIATFGGDPDNVTVIGQSAGGASTMLHVLSPMSKGLFRRAIPMSGVPSCDWSLAYEPTKRAFQLGKQLGIETDDPEKLLDFLQKVPVTELLEHNPTLLMNELIEDLGRFFHFTPVVEKVVDEETFLSKSFDDLLKKGEINDVDILIGYTSCEMLMIMSASETTNESLQNHNTFREMFVPKKIVNERSPTFCFEISQQIIKHYFDKKSINLDSLPEYMKFLNDITLIYHIQDFLQHLVNIGLGRKYLYQFSCISERNIYGKIGEKYGVVGASHLDDLVYLFDPKIANLEIDERSREFGLVTLTCTLFTNFAKYGTPTPDSSLGASWPEYDAANKFYVDIGDKLTIGSNLDEGSYQFWKGIYTDAGVNPLKLFH